MAHAFVFVRVDECPGVLKVDSHEHGLHAHLGGPEDDLQVVLVGDADGIESFARDLALSVTARAEGNAA